MWKSRPVKGDLALLFARESELFNYVQQGDTNFYAQSIRGAYQAFFDSNIQADFVPLTGAGEGSLADYKLAYLPYPVMLKQESAAKLRAWVEQGGTLISEGLPAYFGDHGRAGAKQPNYGLDQLFGATESYVEFTPDLLEKLSLEVRGNKIDGRYFLQEYALAGGTAAGRYANGHIAAVEHRQGKGRTLLIGTFPGGGYYLHHSPEAKKFFAGLLEMAAVKPRLSTDNANVQARLHTGSGGTYLWVTNPTRKEMTVNVSLDSAPAFQQAEDVWGGREIGISGHAIKVTVPARDAAVISLK
jgi:beta-galactosidase